MSKSYFFFGFGPTHPENKPRVSQAEDALVVGGSKEDHEKMVDMTQAMSEEFRKDPPQTVGEQRMIMLEVARKFR